MQGNSQIRNTTSRSEQPSSQHRSSVNNEYMKALEFVKMWAKTKCIKRKQNWRPDSRNGHCITTIVRVGEWSERPLRNDDWQVIADVWLNVYGKIYWLTSNFLIIPNAWLFSKSVHLWAREWYWHSNDHIIFLYFWVNWQCLGPKVSAVLMYVV